MFWISDHDVILGREVAIVTPKRRKDPCREAAYGRGEEYPSFPLESRLYTRRGFCLPEKTFHILSAEREDFKSCMPRKAEKNSSLLIISSSTQNRNIS